MIAKWVEQFHKKQDVKKILVGWWIEGKTFLKKNDDVYAITKLRDPYSYVMAMMCKLYGEPNFLHFKDAWVLEV